MNDNIIGTTIGIYTILYECDYKTNDGHRLYHVKCNKCGWENDMRLSNTKAAKVCKHVGVAGDYVYDDVYVWKNKRIGHIFRGIKQRCYNSKNKAYRWYGAKNIKICDEWLNNPKSFEEWALNNNYEDNLTIERKDENKDYCPENCEWITRSNNAKYKSSTSLIEIDGEIHTGKDWARILGLGENRINIYIREYGLENTIEFIRKYKNNPLQNKISNQNIYKLYMK